MASLSISRAWEETKARIAVDGKLMAVVGAALILLPGIVVGVLSPEGAGGNLGSGLLFTLSSLLGLIGQLAIIRLSIGTAVSVGEAIAHGARRMPIYLLAVLIVVLGMFLALIPIIAIAYALGAPIESGCERAFAESPAGAVLMLFYSALVCFVAIRLLLSSPVASEEPAGATEILRRSWALTAGHWWRLFAFIILFFIAALVVLFVVDWGATALAVIPFGAVEPMSLSALVVAVLSSLVNAGMTMLLAVMLARIYVQLSGRDSIEVGVPRSGT